MGISAHILVRSHSSFRWQPDEFVGLSVGLRPESRPTEDSNQGGARFESGFGKFTAIELTRAGHIVYASMHDLRSHSKEHYEELREIARTEGIAVYPLELDVRSQATARAAADLILAQQRRIDITMNNARNDDARPYLCDQ